MGDSLKTAGGPGLYAFLWLPSAEARLSRRVLHYWKAVHSAAYLAVRPPFALVEASGYAGHCAEMKFPRCEVLHMATSPDALEAWIEDSR